MQRRDECGEERLEELDEEGFECSEKLIYICQLKNTLVGDLETMINCETREEDGMTLYTHNEY